MFVSSVVFANLVDQIGYPYNILYMNNLVALVILDALMHFDVLVILDAFISSTNKP
jgi:hypothetical protein